MSSSWGLSILGLAGALPLYLISLPCLAKGAPAPRYLGGYLILQDLSILWVLQLFDNHDISTQSNNSVLEIVNGKDLKDHARVRVIVALCLLLLALFPLWPRSYVRTANSLHSDASGPTFICKVERWVGSAHRMHPDSLFNMYKHKARKKEKSTKEKSLKREKSPNALL